MTTMMIAVVAVPATRIFWMQNKNGGLPRLLVIVFVATNIMKMMMRS
jgi:hypothetical protein